MFFKGEGKPTDCHIPEPQPGNDLGFRGVVHGSHEDPYEEATVRMRMTLNWAWFACASRSAGLSAWKPSGGCVPALIADVVAG